MIGGPQSISTLDNQIIKPTKLEFSLPFLNIASHARISISAKSFRCTMWACLQLASIALERVASG